VGEKVFRNEKVKIRIGETTSVHDLNLMIVSKNIEAKD
jgi:hypothetical protein